MKFPNFRVIFNLYCICTTFCLLTLFFCIECHGDFVVIGGFAEDHTGGSNAPTYPIADIFSIGQTSVTSLAAPTSAQAAIYGVGIDSFRGTVVYAGEYISSVSLLMFKGSVVSSEITPISLATHVRKGALVPVAFDSSGNAFTCGESYDDDTPLIFRLPFGANTATQISVSGVTAGYLQAIAVGPDNRVILGGQRDENSASLICIVPPGSNEAVLVTLPDPTLSGFINTSVIGIAPDGTAFLAGQNSIESNGQALIYSLAPGSTTATAISIPGGNPNDGGIINGLAIRSDGTVILVGSKGLTSLTLTPLIYKISPGNTFATNIPYPNGDFLSITNVVFDSDGNAIFAGNPDEDGPPVICRLNPDSSEFTFVQLPNSQSGTIQSMAISEENVAVFTGEYTDANNLLLFTLSPGSNIAAAITTPDIRYRDTGYSVAIYNCDGPYDIRHSRPYYYLQLSNTQNTLNQSGL